MREDGTEVFKNAHLADEIRRTLVNLDEIEKELLKAAKAIGSATELTVKYKGRLIAVCDSTRNAEATR
jgi:hypothetical protein